MMTFKQEIKQEIKKSTKLYFEPLDWLYKKSLQMKGLRITSLVFVLLVAVFELVIGILSFTMKGHEPAFGVMFLLISGLLFYLSYKILKEIKDESRRKNQS